MNTLYMAMPGALRMRNLYPLIEGDTSCSLIYDLERATVLDVPEELQLHVASALDTGDLDESLLDWMLAEDLLTTDGREGFEESEAPLVMTNWWSLGLVFRRGGEIHARIDDASLESALGAVEFIFKQSLGAARVTLRLSWGGDLPPIQTLEGILVDANRRAILARQEVRFELALDSWLVTPGVAAFLADYPFHVRLHCGSFPHREPGSPSQDTHAWQLAEKGVRMLSGLDDRLTVQCVLAGPARLRDLWAWAKDLGVRHLDPVRLEEEEPLSQELRVYRRDLLVIGEEVCAELADPRPPIDCQPLSRVVHSLMRSESLVRTSQMSSAFFHGVGDVYPVAGEEAGPAFLSDMWYALEKRADGEGTLGGPPQADGEVDADGTPCAGCWARYLCSHSSMPSSPINASADRREPTEERCAFWRAEVEVGLRFYHRLAHADPLQAMRLFDEPEVSLDPFDRHYPLEQPKVPF